MQGTVTETKTERNSFVRFLHWRTDAPPYWGASGSSRVTAGQQHLQFVGFQELRYVQ
jgi:hypothetical protein